MSFEEVTDCETGIYVLGETDYSISGNLQDFLERRGRKGLDNLLVMMNQAMHLAIGKMEEIEAKRPENQTACAGVSG